MVFSEKPKIRGEDIGEIGSMAWQAALMSRRFLVDNSEICAILIGQAATAMKTRERDISPFFIVSRFKDLY
jgi:predicted acetyltransferase